MIVSTEKTVIQSPRKSWWWSFMILFVGRWNRWVFLFLPTSGLINLRDTTLVLGALQMPPVWYVMSMQDCWAYLASNLLVLPPDGICSWLCPGASVFYSVWQPWAKARCLWGAQRSAGSINCFSFHICLLFEYTKPVLLCSTDDIIGLSKSQYGRHVVKKLLMYGWVNSVFLLLHHFTCFLFAPHV